MQINVSQWFLFLAILSLGFACSNTSQKENSTNKRAIVKNDKIPVVDFTAIEKILQTQDDTLRVFNFWATWCKPCVAELPILEELPTLYGDTPFSLYYISLDFPEQIEDKLVPFLKNTPLNGSIVVLDDPDANSWIDKVDPEWSGAIPATIITKRGHQKFHEGQLNSVKDIQQLIKEIELLNS